MLLIENRDKEKVMKKREETMKRQIANTRLHHTFYLLHNYGGTLCKRNKNKRDNV